MTFSSKDILKFKFIVYVKSDIMDFSRNLYEIRYIKIFRHTGTPDIPDIFTGTDGSGISNFTV